MFSISKSSVIVMVYSILYLSQNGKLLPTYSLNGPLCVIGFHSTVMAMFGPILIIFVQFTSGR